MKAMGRWVWAALLALVATVVLAVYLADRGEPDPPPTPAELFAANAPDVVGMPMDAAIKALRRAHFKVFTRYEGTVTRQQVGTFNDTPALILLKGTEFRERSRVCLGFLDIPCPLPDPPENSALD